LELQPKERRECLILDPVSALNEDRPLFGSPAAERCSFSAASSVTFSGGPTGMATIQFN